MYLFKPREQGKTNVNIIPAQTGYETFLPTKA